MSIGCSACTNHIVVFMFQQIEYACAWTFSATWCVTFECVHVLSTWEGKRYISLNCFVVKFLKLLFLVFVFITNEIEKEIFYVSSYVYLTKVLFTFILQTKTISSASGLSSWATIAVMARVHTWNKMKWKNWLSFRFFFLNI